MWSLARFELLLIVTSVLVPAKVRGIRCHICDNEPTNEDCNANVTECSDGENNVCYTMLLRTETFGRRYRKGCINEIKCHKLEALNNRKTCPYIPSDCIYCCEGKANCNAYNTSPTWPASWWWTVTPLLFASHLAI